MSFQPRPHGISFIEVGYTPPAVIDPHPVVLGPLTLSGNSFPADAAVGAVIGQVRGKTQGSSLAIRPKDDRFALAGDDLNGWSLIVGLSASVQGEVFVTLRETHPDAEGASDNLLAITITQSTGGGGQPPAGFVFLTDPADGAIFTDPADGAYLLEEI